MEIVGPGIWLALHLKAAHYSKNPSKGEQEEMRLLIIGLPALVPCPKCQIHIRLWNIEHSKELNNIVASKYSLFNYFLELHNKINVQNGKQPWTFKKAADYYGYND